MVAVADAAEIAPISSPALHVVFCLTAFGAVGFFLAFRDASQAPSPWKIGLSFGLITDLLIHHAPPGIGRAIAARLGSGERSDSGESHPFRDG